MAPARLEAMFDLFYLDNGPGRGYDFGNASLTRKVGLPSFDRVGSKISRCTMSPKSHVPRFVCPVYFVTCFVIAISMLWGATPLHADRRHNGAESPLSSMPQVPQSRNNPPVELDQTDVVQRRSATAASEYACFLPPLNSVSTATVAVVDLKVPEKPHSEFESGCQALRKNKMADAEKHLRKAIHEYEKYAAAWVLLGQLLETEQKPEEARAACSESLNASATYVPAYLCLSDISTRQKNWDDVLKFSERVLDLDPTTNALAYAYHATANLKLHRLVEAEKNGLKALEIDVKNSEPRIHVLLAQIYSAKGDGPRAVAQLREYLKFAKDPADIALVKNYLARLDGGTAK